jgi:hypothetical protein
MIAEAVAKAPANKFNTGSTSLEWFSRRIKNQRIANRTVYLLSSLSYIFIELVIRVRRRGGLVEAPSGSLKWFEEKTKFKQLTI